jgi:hypothetical protein
MEGKMNWRKVSKDNLPVYETRILTFSEIYRGSPEMAFRIIDSQFLNICSEVTHWCYLHEPEKCED